MTTGAWGEEQAAQYLRKQGWRILDRNFRTRLGELDIVAEKGRFLAFVEVKTRASDRFAAACEAVTPAKQAKLCAAAEQWLQQYPTDRQPRFDVIEVYGTPGRTPRIVLLENAFEG